MPPSRAAQVAKAQAQVRAAMRRLQQRAEQELARQQREINQARARELSLLNRD